MSAADTLNRSFASRSTTARITKPYRSVSTKQVRATSPISSPSLLSSVLIQDQSVSLTADFVFAFAFNALAFLLSCFLAFLLSCFLAFSLTAYWFIVVVCLPSLHA